MGFIRGGLLFTFGVLLLLSLLIGNIFLVLSSSLKYENVLEKLTPVIGKIIYEQSDVSQFQQSFDVMKEFCEQGNSQVVIGEDYEFSISCDEILTGTAESVLNSQIENFMQENYYKNYDCKFIDCFKENSVHFFLISKMAHDYIQNKYYYAICISLILLVLMFFLVENKKNLLIIAGILSVLSSLPFMKLDIFSSVISNKYSSQIFSLFFEQAHVIFWWMFIIGLLVFGIGIGLRFWNFKKHPFFGSAKPARASAQKSKQGFTGFEKARKIFGRKNSGKKRKK